VKQFENIRKILVIKLRHIGDVLLSVPALRALRQTFPHAHISVLVNSGTEAMLRNNPVVDDVMSFDRSTTVLPLMKRTRNEAAFLGRIRRAKFDMTVSLTSGDRAALISLISGARHRLAYHPGGDGFPGKRFIYNHIAPKPKGRHMVLQNLGLPSHFGIDTTDLSVDFHVPDETSQKVAEVLPSIAGKTIHVHPTSRLDIKCWREDYMAWVIEGLLSAGDRVVLTTAPDRHETEMSARIVQRLSSINRLVDLSGKVTLTELAEISRSSDMFFGVDSAPMHLAAAVGTPVVALFGPTKPHRWGPWSNAAANAAMDRDSLRPYREQSAVRRFGEHTVLQCPLDCVPCTKTSCPRDTSPSECLTSITPECVLRELSRTLKES
jgi:heptosyltransferase-3